MDRNLSRSVIDLATAYARYFVEDFASNVMRHLAGSHPVPPDVLKKFIANRTATFFDTTTPFPNLTTNAIGRFLYECAEHVLTAPPGEFDDPYSDESWSTVSALPSAHHDEIQTLVYTSAALYRKTVDVTLLGVIARDAHTTSETIRQAAQRRVAVTETGGSIHVFNWGILNDGLWLNSALIKAYQLASIFRPGDPVVSYYAKTAFDFARNSSIMQVLGEAEQMTGSSELDILIAHSPQNEINDLLANFSQSDLTSMLFTVGYLSGYFTTWERGLTDTTELVRIIKHLSVAARLIDMLLDTAHAMDSDLIGDLTTNRLRQVNDVIVLVLAGYEALRETKFNETLIICVTAEGDDPKVDVVINGDLINSYHAAGGDDADLVRFGLYLDPRKGVPAPSAGWTQSFVMARRDDVVPGIIAEDADRLQRLRDNDAAAIQDEAKKIITQVVNSYLEASTVDRMNSTVFQNINRVVRSVTADNSDTAIDEEVGKILVAVTGDQFLIDVFNRLLGYYASDNKAYASAFAIAETAVVDAVTNMIAVVDEEPVTS